MLHLLCLLHLLLLHCMHRSLPLRSACSLLRRVAAAAGVRDLLNSHGCWRIADTCLTHVCIRPCGAGKDIKGKELFVGRAQKKAEREAMLRAK